MKNSSIKAEGPPSVSHPKPTDENRDSKRERLVQILARLLVNDWLRTRKDVTKLSEEQSKPI